MGSVKFAKPRNLRFKSVIILAIWGMENWISFSWNKRIVLFITKGKYIHFINEVDDFFKKYSCENEIRNLEYINSNGVVVRKWKSKVFEAGAFKKAWMPAHPTFYCRKKIYDKLGWYKSSYKIAGDFELMLRFIEKHGINSKFIDKFF